MNFRKTRMNPICVVRANIDGAENDKTNGRHGRCSNDLTDPAPRA